MRLRSGSTPNLAALGVAVPKDLCSKHNYTSFNEVQRQRSALEKIQREKQGALQELKGIQRVLERNRSDIRQTERHLQDTRAQTEEARTELVLAEYKRDAAIKDIEHFTSDLKVKQQKSQEDEIHRLDTAAVQREEISALMTENGGLKERLRDRASWDEERQELERQVNSTKQELFSEQKKFRAKMDALQEDLDHKSQQLEEALSGLEELHGKNAKTEAKLQLTEREKNTLIEVKIEEFENMRTRLEQQISGLKAAQDEELQALQAEIKALMEQLTKIEQELEAKDQGQCTLKEKVLHLEAELAKETARKDTVIKKQLETIETARSEKTAALQSLRVSLDTEHCRAMEAQHRHLESTHQNVIHNTKQALLGQVQDLQAKLTKSDMELEVTKERLRQQEALVMNIRDTFRQEAQDQARSLIEAETDRWSEEKSDEVAKRVADYRNEVDSTLSRLQDELSVSYSTLDIQSREIMALKQELEGQLHSNRTIYRDKLVALNDIKEAVEKEKDKEMEQFKEKLEKDTFKQMDRLRATVKKQEEDIDSLRAEKQKISSREQEIIAASEKHERAMISDLNEECKRLAEVMGATPRTANLPRFSTLWTATKMPFGSAQNVTHQALQAALKNFRESTSDIRKHIEDHKEDLKRHKDALLRQEQQKSEEFKELRTKFQNEKTMSMEELKTRLIQDHIDEVDKLHKSLGKGNSLSKTLREKDVELREIQRNMNKWRDDTAEKMARKFQGEMAKELDKRVKEFDRYQRDWEHEKSTQQRELDRLECELAIRNAVSSGPILKKYQFVAQGPVTNSPSPSTPAKHTWPRQPTAPSMAASRKLSNSTCDLTRLNSISEKEFPSSPDRSLAVWRHRGQVAEQRAVTAEERAESAQNALNLKMMDYAQLQGNLSQQTKEYLQLERAYSKLQNKAIQPTKPLKSCLR